MNPADLLPASRVARGTILIAALWGAAAVRVALAEPVEFDRDIRPIFVARCYECHGDAKQESGLRLNNTASLKAGGNSGPAFVTGKAAESLLFKAVTGAEDASLMPPEGERLTAEQIDLLKRWIDEGAKAPEEAPPAAERKHSDHWSFKPIIRPQVPATADGWQRNPIDAFIAAALTAKGLQASPEADRPTLLRRASFDLLGLPPTAEQIDQFISDDKPGAYERMIDRLLASPHYGERWGRHWLDVARYADSNGYTIDSGRSIWKYRDWVIAALNRDLPFDRFVTEQLAGDLLPEADLDQRIATGFHRNTLVNEEGGTDPEQFRVEAVVDRVSTTGAAFLGLTVGCARCHDHKYDPISQREFYQLFAIFNNADEPALQVPTDQQSKEMPALLAEIQQVEKRLGDVDASAPGRQADWERRLVGRLDAPWTVVDAEVSSAGGATFTQLEDGSWLVGGDIPARDVYTITIPLPQRGLSAVKLEVLTHESLPRGGPGLADNGNFVLAELSARVAGATDCNMQQRLEFAEAWADYSGTKGDVAGAIDGKDKTGWNISATKDQNTPRTAIFYLRDLAPGTPEQKLTLVLDQHYDKPRYQIGRFRVSVTASDRDVLKLPESARQLLVKPAESRTAEEVEAVRVAFANVDPERLPLMKQIGDLKQQQKQMTAAITTTLVMRERAEPRSTFIHVRGDFLHAGAPVTPGVPAVLPPISARGESLDRLDFARWLVRPDHPLTPRVTVNRIWQTYFGQGLVTTENDFGLQGAKPTHPELLDWLAAEFVDGGWSLKSLHRLILCSATYRQSSHARAELAAADPENKLLGRQQRLRLEAETIRDAALAASGLLSHDIGGPGVYPPQPQGIYRFTQQVKFWGENKDADRYRRGLYTYFWRSSPYPFLKTFDAPDATVACTRRPRSNTPLQALTMANDPAFYEIAQGLARRILSERAQDDDARLRTAVRWSLSREPSAAELAGLREYLDGEQRRFADAPKDAESVAPANTPAGVEPARAAAWTMVARVLLNLDEFITRE